MKIWLSKKYVLNDGCNFSDFDFLVYTGIRIIMGIDNTDYPNDRQFCYVSLNQIIIELFGTLSVSRRIRTEIKKSLLNLCGYDDSKLIKVIGKLDEINNEFILDISSIRLRNDFFILITDTDIHKILNIKFNGFKETLFRYYCVLMSTLNNYNKAYVGNMPLRYIRNQINTVCTETTQLKYNKLLEGAKVLYIHHNEYLMHDSNGVKSFPNFYGRYEDKESIDAVAKQKYSSVKNPITFSPIDSNKKRSNRQKIHALIVRGTKYSDQELADLKSFAEQENKELLDMMTSTDDEMLKYSLSKRLINMSIFDGDCILK